MKGEAAGMKREERAELGFMEHRGLGATAQQFLGAGANPEEAMAMARRSLELQGENYTAQQSNQQALFELMNGSLAQQEAMRQQIGMLGNQISNMGGKQRTHLGRPF